jgi:hypothetical protein
MVCQSHSNLVLWSVECHRKYEVYFLWFEVATVIIVLLTFRFIPVLTCLIAKHCHHALPNRSEFWNPHTLGYKFFAETKRLWELEQYKESSSTTIQAALLLYTIHILLGLDKVAVTYLAQAISMAQKLNLFDRPSPHLSLQEQRSAAITAWSVFWFQR